jgi:integrase
MLIAYCLRKGASDAKTSLERSEAVGSIYRRNGSKKYYIKYYKNGEPFSESTKSDKLGVAKRLLKLREGEISQGKIPGICFERVRLDELVEDYLSDYRINKKKTLGHAKRYAENLKEEFGGMKVPDITTTRIKGFIEKRMADKLTNASINRELSALKRMFSLAVKTTPPKASMVPYIPMLKEDNVRKGFFEHDKYLALLGALPRYLKPLLTFAYLTGWRWGEIVGMKWSQVNLKDGIVRLEPGETKNGKGRTLFLEPELLGLLKDLHRNRRLDCLLVFHRGAKKIGDIRKSWTKACEVAGIPGMLFHDLRRSGVRNMVRAGISETVAMAISGHKTRAVFDRYNITSDDDLKEAARKRQVFIEAQTG